LFELAVAGDFDEAGQGSLGQQWGEREEHGASQAGGPWAGGHRLQFTGSEGRKWGADNVQECAVKKILRSLLTNADKGTLIYLCLPCS
jgi:hypothetical protein